RGRAGRRHGRRDRAGLGPRGGRRRLRGGGGTARLPRRQAHPPARPRRRPRLRPAGRLAGVLRAALAVGHRHPVRPRQRGGGRRHLGGRRAGGPAAGLLRRGTVLGALLMTRWKPVRLLFTGTLCVFPLALPSAALAVPVPVWALCAVMLVTGICLEVFGVSWMTALHQEIPEEKLSRISAYDWFGSVALVPLATALA